MESSHPFIRPRLWVMFFIEFMIWGSWYVPISGYMNDTLKFSGSQVAWIYATTALGAIISPLFVGYVADRFFSTERVLAALHLVGGACLFAASFQEEFPPLMTLLVVNAMCFMPTLALVNSLAFRNIDDPNKFSLLAVGGTIGWIISGWTVSFLLGEATKPYFFWLSGGGSVAMAVYCLTLPHTPPKGGGGDVLGLGALKLLKDPSFLVFAVCAFLISIPLSFYFAWGNAFLWETDSPKPTALQTLSQFSEIVVMLVMPWFIARIGLKNVLVIGMGAWAFRYAMFASLSFPLIIVGLLVHGFCYCFVFVAGFIYVGRKAPPEISASAQSFLAFLMWGVGMFVGMQLSGYVADQYPPPLSLTAIQDGKQLSDQKLPPWQWLVENEATGEKEHFSLPRELGLKKGESFSPAKLKERMPETLTVAKTTYRRDALLTAIERADFDGNGAITRAEWQKARSHDWPPIWLWPGGLALIVCLLFLAGGRDVAEQES